MAIRLDPKLLAGILIPETVQGASDESIVFTHVHGLNNLPAPFNGARLWVSCREAWPHADADFDGMMFITIVVQGAHRYSQMCEGNVVETIEVRPGCVFSTNPLALHWLEPLDPEVGFIAVQWEVPFHEYVDRMEDLVAAIGGKDTPQSLVIESQSALVPVDAEAYTCTPPGYPSLASIQF